MIIRRCGLWMPKWLHAWAGGRAWTLAVAPFQHQDKAYQLTCNTPLAPMYCSYSHST